VLPEAAQHAILVCLDTRRSIAVAVHALRAQQKHRLHIKLCAELAEKGARGRIRRRPIFYAQQHRLFFRDAGDECHHI
jgi:hypothetical protein